MSDGMHLMIPAEEYAEMEAKIERLEKALDKACEYISEIMGSCPYDVHDFQLSRCAECQNECYVCWKEWCMKDE